MKSQAQRATRQQSTKASGRSGGSAKSKTASGSVDDSASTKRINKAKSRPSKNASRQRSRLVSPTPSASDSQGTNDDDGARSMSIDGDNDDSESDQERRENQLQYSPEPDFILAEVTHGESSTAEPPIPFGLVHRILHSQFSVPEKTKISTDAREVVSKYIEVFVREAVMRCAFEKGGGSEEAAKATQPRGSGWLELEDLEKVAVQLCLDF